MEGGGGAHKKPRFWWLMDKRVDEGISRFGEVLKWKDRIALSPVEFREQSSICICESLWNVGDDYSVSQESIARDGCILGVLA